MSRIHVERHRTQHTGWLRAAVLGANDGIVSTASLIVGVIASSATHSAVLVAGVAGLVAGAMSMAAGEYVSVSSQADTEQADIARERQELAFDGVREEAELAGIYMQRGLDANLAKQVAAQLMAKDALAAHTRDELGISESVRANPLQAAFTSAFAFAVGAALPLLCVVVFPRGNLPWIVSVTSMAFLAVLGGLAAFMGRAPLVPGVLRVTFWGALAMVITAGVGLLFGSGA
ncbi:MAG: VIT family protein [Betaproteobacteria bacterium]|nr:VIT family protein [Betaproteobacteria bacterium]